MELERRLALSRLYDFYGALLTRRQQEIFDLYYFKDFSLAEIADAAGISRQAVHDLLQRSNRQLELFEDRLGLAQRFRQQEAEKRFLIEELRDLKIQLSDRHELGQVVSRIEQVIERLSTLGD